MINETPLSLNHLNASVYITQVPSKVGNQLAKIVVWRTRDAGPKVGEDNRRVDRGARAPTVSCSGGGVWVGLTLTPKERGIMSSSEQAGVVSRMGKILFLRLLFSGKRQWFAVSSSMSSPIESSSRFHGSSLMSMMSEGVS